jgi:putative sterol carrier protein
MTLVEALQRFVDVYHAAGNLAAEQRGWHCRIVLVAPDHNESITLRIEDGRVVSIGEQRDEGELIITADAATLHDILAFRRDPNEPYMFGELTVQGPEEHFMRLDYIVTMLCPL